MPAPRFCCSVNFTPGSCLMGNSREAGGPLAASSCASARVALPANRATAMAKLANRPACAILDCSIKPDLPGREDGTSADFLRVMYSVHIVSVKLKIDGRKNREIALKTKKPPRVSIQDEIFFF